VRRGGVVLAFWVEVDVFGIEVLVSKRWWFEGGELRGGRKRDGDFGTNVPNLLRIFQHYTVQNPNRLPSCVESPSQLIDQKVLVLSAINKILYLQASRISSYSLSCTCQGRSFFTW
jgi:hypothetical protein